MLGNFRDVISRLEQQKATIDKAIATLREFDEGSSSEAAGATASRPAKAATKATKKRVMSEEARKRIADAQKKRWAGFRKSLKKTT